jgi:hypothetical protein
MRFLYLLFLPLFPLYADYCIQALSSDSAHKDQLFQEEQRECYQGLEKVRVESRPPYYTLRVGRYKRYHDGLNDLQKVRECQSTAFLRSCSFKDFPIQPQNKKTVVEEPYQILPEIPQPVEDKTQREIKESSYPALPPIKQPIQSRVVKESKKSTVRAENHPSLPKIEAVKKTLTVKKPIEKLPIIEKKKVVTQTTEPISSTTTIVTTKTVTTTKVVQMPVWDACQRCFTPMYKDEE